MPLCYSANVKLGGPSEARGAQQKISGWMHDDLNDSSQLIRHLLLLDSFSLCCTTLWNPAGTTLGKTSQSSFSLSSEKSLSQDCQLVTKLCFHLGHGWKWALQSISIHSSSKLKWLKRTNAFSKLLQLFKHWRIFLFRMAALTAPFSVRIASISARGHRL